MEEEQKNRYVLGTIGALIGAFVGAIPWILMYVYGNTIYALLSILIVVGSFYGYKLTKAKIDKKLPVILSITSFVSITVTTLIIIPIVYMVKEKVPVNLEMFKLIYSFDEFISAIMTDYIISLLFCIAVIGSIIYNLNKQIKQGVDAKDIKIISGQVNNETFSEEDIDKVKNVFDNHGALNKNEAITKDVAIEDLTKEFGEEKGKKIFDYLKVQGVIKKKSNKYYFSEKAEHSAMARYGFTNIKTFIIILACAIVLGLIIVFTQEYHKETDMANTNQIEDTIPAPSGETTYSVEGTELKMNFESSDMHVLSEEEIEYYFGETYVGVYDCMAASEDFGKVAMVFSAEKSLYEGNTEEEILKMLCEDENIEINETKISNYTFYGTNRPYETTDGGKYVEQDYLFASENKFICIVFDSLETQKLNIKDIIS